MSTSCERPGPNVKRCMGHHAVIRVVNSEKASSGVRRTMTSMRIGSTSPTSDRTSSAIGLTGRAILRDGRESAQCIRPEEVEKCSQPSETVRIYRVEPPVPVRAVDHQTGVLQHLQVLRDGGPADRQVAGNVDHREGSSPQAVEDPATGSIAEGLEDGVIRNQ